MRSVLNSDQRLPELFACLQYFENNVLLRARTCEPDELSRPALATMLSHAISVASLGAVFNTHQDAPQQLLLALLDNLRLPEQSLLGFLSLLRQADVDLGPELEACVSQKNLLKEVLVKNAAQLETDALKPLCLLIQGHVGAVRVPFQDQEDAALQILAFAQQRCSDLVLRETAYYFLTQPTVSYDTQYKIVKQVLSKWPEHGQSERAAFLQFLSHRFTTKSNSSGP